MINPRVINAVKMDLYALTVDVELLNGVYVISLNAGMYEVRIPAMQIDTLETSTEVINLIVDTFRTEYKKLGC